MVQPKKWVLGLLPLAAIALVAALWRQGSVEKDLASRVAEGLNGGGSSWAKVLVVGRDGMLTGEAPSPEARAKAQSMAESIFGVRKIADAMTVLPEARPFTFTVLRDGAKITLAGAVPPGDLRQKIVETIRKSEPGLTVVDEMRAARGASAAFAALVEAGLSNLVRLSQGTLSISDSALSLSGRAADFNGYREIRAALGKLPPGTTLAKGLAQGDILPPIAAPFAFSAELGAGGLSLSGAYPSENARERVLAAAKALGVTIADRLQIADGAPKGDWAGAATLLIAELGKLEAGRASLADGRAGLTGRAKGLLAEEDFRNDLRALPAGFALADLKIESRVIRPYRFQAERRGDTLTLTGHVPDAKARASVLDIAKAFFEGDRIEDRLQEGLGEPKGFLAAVQAGLQELSRLADGASLSISDSVAALKGAALFDAARDQVAQGFSQGIPQGFERKLDVSTAPLPPVIDSLPDCQALYTNLLKTRTVRFKSGSADLSEASRAILDRLAVISLRCTTARIEIGGHTDNDGSPQSNAELSRRRAETVGVYLVRAGVMATRLEPVGFGETVPVAPNDSPENKAKNRRIEFFVK
ncbi:MAG TPA: OmpA family protein [Rhabdaerophilum sp.]|nr:OmpA family protein [Rhabdaerophilum sp.]